MKKKLRTLPRRSFLSVAMRARGQAAGRHRDARKGRGNPRSEARRAVREETS